MNDQEQIVADMWTAGASAKDIGRRVGIGKDAVYTWVRRLGLPINRRASRVESEEANPTPSEIAERAAYVRRMRELGTPIGGV